MLKIKYYQATVWEVFKKRPADEVYVCLEGNSDSLITTNRQFNNYELTGKFSKSDLPMKSTFASKATLTV